MAKSNTTKSKKKEDVHDEYLPWICYYCGNRTVKPHEKEEGIAICHGCGARYGTRVQQERLKKLLSY